MQLDSVIRHQAVSALNQFQGSFALADAALAGDEHTLTEDIHQYAVDRERRSQRLLQVTQHTGEDIAGVATAGQQRHAVLSCQFQHILIRHMVSTID